MKNCDCDCYCGAFKDVVGDKLKITFEPVTYGRDNVFLDFDVKDEGQGTLQFDKDTVGELIKRLEYIHERMV